MICYVCNAAKVIGDDGYCVGPGCEAMRALPDPTFPIVTAVPGGANNNVDHQRDTEAGLKEYKAAKDAGVQPNSTHKGATAKAEAEIESQQRAIDKLKQDGGIDTSKVKVRPEVNV